MTNTSDIATHEERAWKAYCIAHAQAMENGAALTEARERIVVLEGLLRGIKWKSADRDNMEFAATITYSQMDEIRALLTGKDA